MQQLATARLRHFAPYGKDRRIRGGYFTRGNAAVAQW
jgi:hypothetical protein